MKYEHTIFRINVDKCNVFPYSILSSSLRGLGLAAWAFSHLHRSHDVSSVSPGSPSKQHRNSQKSCDPSLTGFTHGISPLENQFSVDALLKPRRSQLRFQERCNYVHRLVYIYLSILQIFVYAKIACPTAYGGAADFVALGGWKLSYHCITSEHECLAPIRERGCCCSFCSWGCAGYISFGIACSTALSCLSLFMRS